jgi:periplasmic protein TonB
LACGVYEGMFEQSMLLPPAPGKRAGALAASLAAQTFAVGTLLLIPLLYTDRLPFALLQLPTFLPPTPAPEPVKPEAPPHRQIVANVRNPFIAPTTIPPLNTQPEIIDDTAVPLTGIDTGAFLPPTLGTIFSRVIPPPPPPPQVTEVAPSKPITVTSDVQAAKLLRKVIPVYPRLAIAAHISGTVRLIGVVAKDGTVQQIRVVSGSALLVEAALDAVRQWVYRPTMLNNKPVEVIAPIDVNFTLTQ